MVFEVEISTLDLHYESYRLKNTQAEQLLLSSIAQSGVRDAVKGVKTNSGKLFLLDGFKRFRCCQKLNRQLIPFKSVGNNEVLGILHILRLANENSLNIIEQAKLIDSLSSEHHLSVGELATRLEKSKAWVSLRNGLINEMSMVAKEKVFAGHFPAYAYMTHLKPFMRVNKVPTQDCDQFMLAVSGKQFSVRDIEQLIYGYFRGSGQLREQIQKGNVDWALKRIKDSRQNNTECNSYEKGVVRDLEIVQKYMQRLTYRIINERLSGASFYAQSSILCAGILRILDSFQKVIRGIYDRQ